METVFALVETLWLSCGAFLFFALTLVLGGEYARQLFGIPTVFWYTKVFELALTLFTVEDALVLASIGVEEEDWLDGVGVGKVDADGNKIRPEK
jgi:hypothetical protein